MSELYFIGKKDKISLTLALLLMFSPVSSISEEGLKKDPGQIVITSDRLYADNIRHTALFEGRVVAKTEDMTIYSDRMMIYYDEKGKRMERIEASGNVKIIKGERTVTSQNATYHAEEEKVIFIGNPEALEGDSKVTGDIITHFLKEDRIIVENANVVIIRKRDEM